MWVQWNSSDVVKMWGILRSLRIFTGRNEVVAKVMFLQVSVIHSVHRGVLWRNQGEPPPLRAGRTPPGRETPPGWETPPRKQTPAYGLRAASTHPTGMHSC